MSKISKRLHDILVALPIEDGMHILEVGCGSGVLARAIVQQFSNVSVVAIDCSAKAIQQLNALSLDEIKSGRLLFKQIAIEEFVDVDGNTFDMVIAIRVGALDGRHPELELKALTNISHALKENGKFYIDNEHSIIKEINLRQK